MTEWRIKEISTLTKVSIRMLRYYDKIGLLKPSYRMPNGYRCYTENDLAKLQQIIALRYLGFTLSKIKTLLQKHQNIYAHLQAQQRVLKEQHIHLKQVEDTLSSILNRLSPTQSPRWTDLITLIERYRMTDTLREKLKKSWAGQQLTESQFEEYLFIYEKFPKEFSDWDKTIEKINRNEIGDPESPAAEEIINSMYDLARKTKKLFANQTKLSASIMKSIQSGQLSQLQLTPEGINWMSRAILSHWLKRWNSLSDHIVENLNKDPEGMIGKKVAQEWVGLTNDMLASGPKSLSIGLMIWQELEKQRYELNESKKLLTPKDLIKPYHIKLLFNPEAMSWIARALETHG